MSTQRWHLKEYRDKQGQWRWTLIAKNGKKVANGGEAYKRHIDCRRMVCKLFPWLGLDGL